MQSENPTEKAISVTLKKELESRSLALSNRSEVTKAESEQPIALLNVWLKCERLQWNCLHKSSEETGWV